MLRSRRPSSLVVCLAIAGTAVLRAAPARAWLRIPFPGPQTTAARALAIAPDQTIVAAGDIAFGSLHRPVIFRLLPTTGETQGLAFPGLDRDGRLNALALSGADAIVAGALRGDADEFLVARVGPNGFDGWVTELAGAATCGDDVANAVALDPDGGVVAAGMFTNVAGEVVEQTFAVVKLDVTDGAVIWRTEIPNGVARALVMEGFDPLVVGTIGGELAVVKLAAGTGKVLWQRTVGAGDGYAAALGGAGEVYAAGRTGGAFAVVKLETDTGGDLWTLPSGTLEGDGIARAVTRLSGGDVVAAGESGSGASRMFVTARFFAADGGIDWVDADPSIPSPAAAYAVAHDDLDDLVSVGTAADPNFPASFAARSVFGGDGALRWGTGILSDDAETRALTVLFDDDGNVVLGGQLALYSSQPSFAVQKLDGATGKDFVSLCGNDQLDPGEECDDANTEDGDCCSSTCRFEPADQACNGDGNDCTADTCDGEGTCRHLPVLDGSTCDDGNDCTDGDACTGGQCFAKGLTQAGTPCNADSNPCTTDTCNGDGGCVPRPNTDPCNDFNPCTTADTCNGQGFCQGTPQTGGTCEDGNDCTHGDTCVEGLCRPGSIQQGAACSDDFNPCTNDVCNSDGLCTHPSNADPCTDDDACTAADHCENGACTGMPVTPGSTTTTSSTTASTTSSTSSTTSSSTTSSTTSSSSSTTAPLPTTTSTTAPVPTTTSSSSSTSSSTTSTVATTSSTTSTVATTSSTTSTVLPTSTTTSTSSTSSTAPTTSTIATTSTTTSSTTSTTTAPSTTLPPTTTTSTSSTSTTTLPAACRTSADCDDGDPCNGGEACANGRCLVSRGKGTCEGPDPLAAITSFDADVVTFVNVRTHAADGATAVGRGPWGVAWSPDGARIYVTNRDAKSVSVVDVASRTVVGTVAVGGQPLGVAVHPFLPRAYVTSYDDDLVSVVDTSTLAVVDTIHVGNGPAGLAIHPAGAELYVANYLEGSVSVIDAATGAILGAVHTPALPVGIAIAPDGTKAYVACLKARSVAVVGTVSHSLLGTIRVGRKPVGVAFDGARARAYVTNSADDTLTVIDTTTDHVIAKLPVGDYPLGVAVADDSTVFVANGKAHDLGFVDDGGVSTLAMPKTPVAIGSFIGTPPGECARDPLPCDDANPYTGDACTPGVGCSQTPIEGLASIRAGVAAMRAILEGAGRDDPVAPEVARELGTLESALSAAETGASRDALKLVRRMLKPILKTLEAARRDGTLGAAGARLLDIAREARMQLTQLVRSGG